MNIRSGMVLAIAMLWAPVAFGQGFYFGGGIGVTQLEDEEEGIGSFDDSPLGWRILAGYEFTENFAVEGAYVNSGEAEDTIQGVDIEAELKGFTVSGIGLLPVSDSVKLFGKLGYYNGETEASAFGVTVDEDESGLTLGAGLRFDLGNNFAIRGEFDWFDAELDTLWAVGVNLQYMIGR